MALFKEERGPRTTGIGPGRVSLARATIALARARRLDRCWKTKGRDVLGARERVAPLRAVDGAVAALAREREEAKECAVEIQMSSDSTGLDERSETID